MNPLLGATADINAVSGTGKINPGELQGPYKNRKNLFIKKIAQAKTNQSARIVFYKSHTSCNIFHSDRYVVQFIEIQTL